MRFKKILSLVLVLGMIIGIPAVNQDNLLNNWNGEAIYVASQSGRDNAQDELDDLNDQLDDLKDGQSDIEDKLSEKAQALSELLAEKEILENDMAETQAAIDQAKLDLADAKRQEEESYESMKIRIQYMYENSTQDSIWDALLNASGLSDLLNRVEYINQVHKTDRELLDEHKALVQQIEILAAELDANMNDLVALQEIYEHQEVDLANAMAALQEEAEDYQTQIAAAERRAGELADYIEEQNRLIEEKRRQEEQKKKEENKKPTGDLTDPSKDPAFTTDVSGEELVSYALQFVGNPYKWGGNSLTNGCDCSGFVNLVYKHFGISVPRQSQAFKSVGQAVSFDNIKAGDIVVYPGHVAIYIGNGCIVEAQSSRAGITSNRSVTCSTITAIRRVL